VGKVFQVRDTNSVVCSSWCRDKGRSVIEDREQNAHGTLRNQTADSLVRNNPDRYGYVDKPNFWKGIDY
jgi:hypothetical protein